MRQCRNQVTILLNLTVATLLNVACSPGFKTMDSISQPSSTMRDLNNTSISESCFISGPSEVVLGSTGIVKISYNFSVPAEAKLFWNGTNEGTAIQPQAYAQQGKRFNKPILQS